MPGIFYSLTNPLIHEVLMITGNLRKRRAMHDEKRERETKEYLEFVEQFQAFLILMTEEWGAKVTLQKGGEAEEAEDLLVVELN